MRSLSAVAVCGILWPAPVVLAQAESPASGKPRVKMETSMGHIVLELEDEKMPITVHNFLRYAQDGFYDGTVFHRVIQDYIIQGGGRTPQMDEKKEGLRPPIFNEYKTGLKNYRGTVAMARRRAEPDSAQSEFFINLKDNEHHDDDTMDGAAYAAFGKVIEGMDVVEAIRFVAVDIHPKYGNGSWPEVPLDPMVIRSVRLMGEYDLEALARRAAAEVARLTAGQAQKRRELEDLVQQVVQAMEERAGTMTVQTSSGLYYVDLVAGTGEPVHSTDVLAIHYVIALPDGAETENSYKKQQVLRFDMQGRFLKGWVEGLSTMRTGGKRMMLLRPELAYGTAGRPPLVKPDAPIIIVTEVLKIMERDGLPYPPGTSQPTSGSASQPGS